MSRFAAPKLPRRHSAAAMVTVLCGVAALQIATASAQTAFIAPIIRDGGATPATVPSNDRISSRHGAWLAEVEAIMTPEERDLFLRLRREYQRAAFVRQFWKVRDPVARTGRNEMRERWEERVAYARRNFGGLTDARSRVLLVHGEPHRTVQVRCTTTRIPAELWVYRGSERVRFDFLLVFVRPGGLGEARVWAPGRGDIRGVVDGASTCINGHLLEDVVDQVRDLGDEYGRRIAEVLARPRPRNEEWVAAFAAAGTDLPPDARLFDAKVSYAFPGRFQSRTVVQGQVRIRPGSVTTGDFAGYRSRDFVLAGEVVLDGELFESFRYKFGFPEPEGPAAAAEQHLLLPFQRYLRPGSYRIVLKVEDINGPLFFRTEQDVEVPTKPATESTGAAERPHLPDEGSGTVAAEAVAVRLLKPAGEILSGLVRFDAVVEGREVTAVSFLLDDREIVRRTRPPFGVELDLGSFPRPRTLRAEGLDERGDVLAWDELPINAGDQRFSVRLVEPRGGTRHATNLRARADLTIPEGATLDRLEFYLNENLAATLYQAPFVQPIQLPDPGTISWVRAVAHLADGNATEDLVFVNAPVDMERVDVQLVELFVSVRDRGGSPLDDLKSADFRVLEDGQEQRISRFERVRDLPIHVAVVIDNSASMRDSLDITRRAALRFFEQAIKPRDRAAVITFNRFPRLAVRLTSNLRDLGSGLAGLTAEGQTALHDSLMFSLYHLAGASGQRAILLLSDGRDEVSRYSFEDTLEYARRAGVTVYAIGLGIQETAARRRLDRLSTQTGGRSYFLRDPAHLDAIYDDVQRELRSQYLLAYQSASPRTDAGFREVDVRLPDRPRADIRTISGYYP